jgi:hypothetical protein
MINSNDAYFDLTGEATNTSVQETVKQYIQQNGAALGDIAEVDAAYQNGQISKEQWQETYVANAEGLINQAQSTQDVKKILENLDENFNTGKISSTVKSNLEKQLYSKFGKTIDVDDYAYELKGYVKTTVGTGENQKEHITGREADVSIGGQKYTVITRVGTVGESLSNILDNMVKTLGGRDIVRYQGVIYLRSEASWVAVEKGKNSEFYTAFNNLGKSNIPNDIVKNEIK